MWARRQLFRGPARDLCQHIIGRNVCIPTEGIPFSQHFEDTTRCKVTPVISHGVVSPEAQGGGTMKSGRRRGKEDRRDAMVERDSAEAIETVDTFERAELPPLLTTACSDSGLRVEGSGFRVPGKVTGFISQNAFIHQF